MALRRGDIVLVPFPFSDLRTTKVRPAVVVSGALYHTAEPDLLLAALTSRLAAATGALGYVLRDWQAAGLRFPSAFKPVLLTLEPGRVLHHVRALTSHDLSEVDRRLLQALDLEQR
jgi:mRNA interferase MazF